MCAAQKNPGYRRDLGLQGLLCLYDVTGDERYLHYVQDDVRSRGHTFAATLNWKYVFTDIHSEIWMRTGARDVMDGWLADVHDFDQRLPRDKEGRIVFFVEPEKRRLLVDLLQGYALRMARAGVWADSPVYHAEAYYQFQRYARVLVNPRTGLWHHGRGWFAGHPCALSPDGWCRGQAWVLRGLVECLLCFPQDTPMFAWIKAQTQALADALLRTQSDRGMWFQIMTDPAHSYPETSGTGMIVYYLCRAIRQGWLDAQRYEAAVRAAQNALLSFVGDDGQVYNGCPHGPPLAFPDAYNARKPVPDEPHAVAAIMMAGSVATVPSKV